MTATDRVQPAALLSELWREAELPPDALGRISFSGQEPVLHSSFAVATMLQASLGAAALAAAEWGRLRGAPMQQVHVDALDVARECSCRFAIDGRVPEAWDKLAGLYRCRDGWIRLHTNFAHHRDAALRTLGLPLGGATPREAVAAVLAKASAPAMEDALMAAGGVAAAVRGPKEWRAHPQSAAVAAAPLLSRQRLGDAAALTDPPWQPGDGPLAGLRVLDLTRILAGPVAARTLAAYGADVLLVNGPHLPNIEAIAETSRGKLSALIDLREGAGRARLRQLVQQADVVLHGYRPGALAALGFDAASMAALRPGLVSVSLSAYGDSGPWAGRRGFDSLVQSATGLNVAEAAAFGQAEPRALPLQALDYGAGFLLAFGTVAALWRQRQQGGSLAVHVSLARVGHWLASLPRRPLHTVPAPLAFDAVMEDSDSGYGRLRAVPHAARLSHTPARWLRPSMPPGSHAPMWPERLSPRA